MTLVSPLNMLSSEQVTLFSTTVDGKFISSGNRSNLPPLNIKAGYPPLSSVVEMSAPQSSTYNNGYDSVTDGQHNSPKSTGLVGSTESPDESKASSSVGQVGSDAEEEGSATAEIEFQHTSYDPQQYV